jgi:hypothetical protein
VALAGPCVYFNGELEHMGNRLEPRRPTKKKEERRKKKLPARLRAFAGVTEPLPRSSHHVRRLAAAQGDTARCLSSSRSVRSSGVCSLLGLGVMLVRCALAHKTCSCRTTTKFKHLYAEPHCAPAHKNFAAHSQRFRRRTTARLSWSCIARSLSRTNRRRRRRRRRRPRRSVRIKRLLNCAFVQQLYCVFVHQLHCSLSLSLSLSNKVVVVADHGEVARL